MKKMRLFLFALVLSGVLFGAGPACHAQAGLSAAPAVAAPSATAPVSSAKPALAMTPLPLAPLASQIGQTLQTLVGVSSAQPAAPAASTALAPVAAAPAVTATDSEDNGGQGGDTFASDMLDTLNQAFVSLKADSAVFAGNLAALPDFIDWVGHQGSDPRRQALWSAVGSDLLVIVGIPLLGGIAVALLLLPLRLRLRQQSPASVQGRIGILFSLFVLRLIPLVIFLAAALLLLDQNETRNLPRYVILNIVYALAVVDGIRLLLRAVFAPGTPQLRLTSFTTEQAVYACRWLIAFSIIIVCGYYFTNVADALRVPPKAIIIFQNLFGVVLTVMAIVVILQTRMRVALMMRGKKTDRPSGWVDGSRQWLARHWHSLAIAYLIISLSVTVLGINNGIALMLRGTILTFVTLVLSRVSFLALDRWTMPNAGSGSMLHRQVLSFLLRPFVWAVAVVSIASIWGFHIKNFIGTASGQRVINAFLTVVLTLLILTIVYETINGAIERHLARRDKVSKLPVASARARTLLPMVRNTVFILFCGVAVLTALAAVGLNMGPVLAGAGVVGVAIGFGSQSLVKDFLTGLFIVVENSVAIGDVVTIGAFSGVVEALSIRTIRLRDQDGSLHILPFSEVSKLTNMMRDFAYAVVDVNVSYDSDLEHVMQVLREIGAGLQADPLFKRVIEEPIEVLGIETLGDSAITIRSRIRTRPGKQWDVKRLLLLRIVQRFAREKITIPYPTVTHITSGPPV